MKIRILILPAMMLAWSSAHAAVLVDMINPGGSGFSTDTLTFSNLTLSSPTISTSLGNGEIGLTGSFGSTVGLAGTFTVEMNAVRDLTVTGNSFSVNRDGNFGRVGSSATNSGFWLVNGDPAQLGNGPVDNEAAILTLGLAPLNLPANTQLRLTGISLRGLQTNEEFTVHVNGFSPVTQSGAGSSTSDVNSYSLSVDLSDGLEVAIYPGTQGDEFSLDSFTLDIVPIPEPKLPGLILLGLVSMTQWRRRSLSR